VTRRLAGVDAPWAVVAGWALDLFRGKQTREHEDLEIAVPERSYAAIAEALASFDHFAVGDGLAQPATEESLAAAYQTWVRERETGVWRLDVMREPWEGDTWICRRDQRIRRPGADVVARTSDGIPYQQPEIVLLFKAKAMRPKDEADFASVLPLLDSSRRRWLSDALALVHPGHRWLEALS
jgi:hypothetical protein